MTSFEQTWHNKYMNNMVLLDTLNKLVSAEKLERFVVEKWIVDRKEKQVIE